MYPAPLALPDELGEAYLPLLLHLLYEVEQTTIGPLPSSPKGEVFRHREAYLPPLGDRYVCSTAQQVVTVLCATYEVVQLLTSVSTTDHYRFTPRLAYGIEQLVY